ncbi:hypothetical protein ACJMK2_027769 [Sinanodonta woodiana]|uniref:Uncharacterized protein n=1 Tax=Sinanodonta woodiana TaxID=1069815 RepID=A0ABD3X8I5_SINWO
MKIGSITLALLVIVQLIQVASWCINTIDYLLLNGWTQYNGAFYKQFGDTILNYADYEMHCQSYGGSLATAKTYEENAFVYSIVT